jgi:hypothetical protein
VTSADDFSHHSDDSGSHHLRHSSVDGGDLPPPVLVYHESARSIVFRDHIRRAYDAAEEAAFQLQKQGKNGTKHVSFLSERAPSSMEDTVFAMRPRSFSMSERYIHEDPSFGAELSEMSNLFGAPEGLNDSLRSVSSIEIQGFQPTIDPLPQLELGQSDEFEPLLESDESRQEQFWTDAEKQVCNMLQNQRAVVKTVKNSEWTDFLHRFKNPLPPRNKYPTYKHNDIGPHGTDFPFNSFVTSTTLLPRGCKKMRAFGAPATYTTGVVFGLPTFDNDQAEQDSAAETKTWGWPSGYSAKTEVSYFVLLVCCCCCHFVDVILY